MKALGIVQSEGSGKLLQKNQRPLSLSIRTIKAFINTYLLMPAPPLPPARKSLSGVFHAPHLGCRSKQILA
jgi:hypothetical protein